ncbi:MULTISPECIES: Sec-independent protein translocase protein TatB [Xenorhabdus]|uniref:Sec-independent protein translocase protein TatB n=1 Tax=Xenorhabdus ehlersii TaxID=290111 RepID=A0A2D0IVE7_9GAMM|nr:Sec-independent protein translocase protein TatB [Xenorhabdus ehlersii]MBC8948065.1 sec-independent translocase [Xenorhabdus sp. TS4]PHM25875.1 sec-independent translocase [Xenorhabdus ehlersii]RKE87088.1 sec-independent protein translocase protein TatB [Xenorhabdus ehlersii]
MFDIGFSELLLVMIIGLVVLGPERLPIAVKTVAGWIRVLRSLAANVQNELAQELKLQELQDTLKKMEEKADLQSLSPELKASMEELKEAAESLKNTYQLKPDEMRDLEEDETHFHSSGSQSVVRHSNSEQASSEPVIAERSSLRPEQQKRKSPEQANGEH